MASKRFLASSGETASKEPSGLGIWLLRIFLYNARVNMDNDLVDILEF